MCIRDSDSVTAWPTHRFIKSLCLKRSLGWHEMRFQYAVLSERGQRAIMSSAPEVNVYYTFNLIIIRPFALPSPLADQKQVVFLFLDIFVAVF